jgi:phosphoribosylanthranilate isomerase
VSRVRIKFCGMTRPGDIRLACELGVDAVGFVFAARSPRRIHLRQAEALREAVAPLVCPVALFMDNVAEEVWPVLRALAPGLLQFHGREDAAFCERFGIPYLKTLPMGEGVEAVERIAREHPHAAGYLLDGHRAGEAGGQGRAFDWARLPVLARPALLAGGLRPDNVGAAIARARPHAVDVSSGIEVAPGIKDGERMRHFVDEVRRAEHGSEGG